VSILSATIEQQVFKKRRFVPARMTAYGFTKAGSGYTYEKDFMDGDFHAVIEVSGKSAVSGTVVDKMNQEEYYPLRQEAHEGAYVHKVQCAYRALLEDIADACCERVLFLSDQANRITDRILEAYDVRPDFPWSQKRYQANGAFRHADSGKWFALLMNVKWDVLLKNGDQTTVDVVNLKIDPACGAVLRAQPGIYPGYHMNHKNWISVVLDGTLADEAVMGLVADSYRLTEKK
jgi:predicted DNA-binding protein (MmcQ/YjbR family)